MNVLKESQDERDVELSQITGIDKEIIKRIDINDNSKIVLYHGEEEPTEKEEIEKIYTSYGSDNNDLIYIKKLMYSSIHDRHPEIFEVIGNTMDKKCLEFGSGVATHSIALWENNNDVSILDLPGPLMRFALKRFELRGAKVRTYDHNSELPEHTFDLVICSDVLEHTFDPILEITKIHKTLKKGGILCLHVALDESIIHGHFKRAINRWKTEGVQFVEKHFSKIGNILFVKD